jgi:hypothetical protein
MVVKFTEVYDNAKHEQETTQFHGRDSTFAIVC